MEGISRAEEPGVCCKVYGLGNRPSTVGENTMRRTRVYSGKWIFDGAEYHRAGVDEVQNVEAVRFYPRVDIRHHEYHDVICTYKTDPVHAGFVSLAEARSYAETARDEWEGGKRALYRIPELDDSLSWPKAREEESRNQQQEQQPQITVGSLVTAKCELESVSWAEESGVCFEVYELGNRPGYGFIFQRGGYDGFSPDEVKRFLEVSGSVSEPVADYQFKNVSQLQADYGAGRFDAAFEEQNIEKVTERCFTLHPRDILRREYDENLRREAAGIEPKCGMDVDFDSGRD